MTGPSHREPLDEHERELARVLRALPAAEPPAALDQRILRAAADASATPRRARYRWLAFGGTGWGIGGAAAAVLALGVSWHLIDPTRNAPFERSTPTTVESSDDAVTVTLAEPAARPGDAYVAPQGAAPEAAPAPAFVQEKRSPPRTASARTRATTPAPAAGPVEAPAVAAPPPPPASPPEAFADLAGTASDATGTYAPAPATIDTEASANVQARAERAEASRETAAVTALAQAEGEADAAKARADMLSPVEWLAQVRKLRDTRRRAEAAQSLRRFRQVYPHHAIPADLLPLLQE